MGNEGFPETGRARDKLHDTTNMCPLMGAQPDTGIHRGELTLNYTYSLSSAVRGERERERELLVGKYNII